MSKGEVLRLTLEERIERLNQQIMTLGCEMQHVKRLLYLFVDRVKQLELEREERQCDAEDSEPQYIGDIGHRAVRGVQSRPAR